MNADNLHSPMQYGGTLVIPNQRMNWGNARVKQNQKQIKHLGDDDDGDDKTTWRGIQMF